MLTLLMLLMDWCTSLLLRALLLRRERGHQRTRSFSAHKTQSAMLQDVLRAAVRSTRCGQGWLSRGFAWLHHLEMSRTFYLFLRARQAQQRL